MTTRKLRMSLLLLTVDYSTMWTSWNVSTSHLMLVWEILTLLILLFNSNFLLDIFVIYLYFTGSMIAPMYCLIAWIVTLDDFEFLYRGSSQEIKKKCEQEEGECNVLRWKYFMNVTWHLASQAADLFDCSKFKRPLNRSKNSFFTTTSHSM